MSRADRLMDLLDLLRGHALVTVEQLAHTLAVSPRTLRRDLASLRRRGWHIEGSTGPGGGVWLRRAAGVRSVQFSDAELVALWLAGRVALESGRLPWSGPTQQALNRLLAGLPAERARLVRTLNDRVLVVHPVSPEVAEGLGPVADQVIRSVEEAFTQGRCLRFEYQDGRGRRTARLVEPHGLLIRTPAWYLLSRDVHKDAARMFRMDRISAPQVEAARSFLPDIDALYALWHAQEAERATPTAPDRSRDR